MSFSDPKQKLSDNSADIEAELQRLEALGPEEAKRSGTTNGFTIRKAKLIARHLGLSTSHSKEHLIHSILKKRNKNYVIPSDAFINEKKLKVGDGMGGSAVDFVYDKQTQDLIQQKERQEILSSTFTRIMEMNDKIIMIKKSKDYSEDEKQIQLELLKDEKDRLIKLRKKLSSEQ